MGKIRARMLGLEDIEKQQKEEQKKKSAEKKMDQAETKEEKKGEAKEEASAKVTAPEAKKEPKKVAAQKARGKKYTNAKKQVAKGTKMKLAPAVELIKKMKFASFDESVDIHMNVVKTGLRGEVELPYTTGKTVRVAIVDDKVLEALAQNKIEFDVLITHPSFMPKLARFAKLLGPKGLMPNPKAGTISPTPEVVAQKFMKGTLRWKTEPKFPLLHQMVGKASHDSAHLVANAQALIRAVGKANIKNVFIATSMGPSVEIEIEE